MAAASFPPSPPPVTDATATSLPDLSVPYDLATGQWQALLSHLSHPSHAQHPQTARPPPPIRALRPLPRQAQTLPRRRSSARLPPPGPGLPAAAVLPLFLPDRSLPPWRSTVSTRSSPPSAPAPTPDTPSGAAATSSSRPSLAADHLAHREFDVALALLADIAAREPSNPVVLSRLAYAHLQIGNLTAASATFRHVGSVVAAAADSAQYANLLARNRALECIVGKDYAAAVREYESCIEADPADAVALNNKALCLMYSRDLGDAIKVLEGALERVSTAALNETVVVNLCSMSELAYVNHGEVKRSLAEWIARVAPDDFDTSCTRM